MSRSTCTLSSVRPAVRPAVHPAVCPRATLVAALTAVLLAPAPADAARTFEPCRYEDGPGPCVWDAKHRGNGLGDSFILRRDGRTVHITHRRAHRLVR